MGVHRHPFFNRGIRVRYEVVTADASRDLLLFLLYQLTPLLLLVKSWVLLLGIH